MIPADEFIRRMNKCLHRMDSMIESGTREKKGRPVASAKPYGPA